MLSRLLKKNNDSPLVYARKKHFFDAERKSFYGQLRRAIPKCYIFPDVELASLMLPTSADPRIRRVQEEHLKGRRVDYALFDARLDLMCVIELTPPGVDDNGPSSNKEYLRSANIRRYTWPQDNLPSTDQIKRSMADFSGIVLDIEGAPSTILAPATQMPGQPRRTALSQVTIDLLTPKGHIKNAYPHIWEKICLVAAEPAQLEQYLASLSLQDRGSSRAGFPQDVIIELTSIQSANERFLAVKPVRAGGGWDDAFILR
jgi:hypothetical protein